jgi:hypothetical protein
VIIFFTDQQWRETVGLHGNPLHLDRAAQSRTQLFNL